MVRVRLVENYLNKIIMDFSYFKKFIVDKNGKTSKKLKHSFYLVSQNEIDTIDRELKIPYELKQFYSIVGFGYMFDSTEYYSIDKFLSPDEFKKINFREEYYKFDPTLEIFNTPEYKNKLIFFEVNEGVYLLIDKNDVKGKNAIYYFDDKIANSLDEFLMKFDKEGHYFED